MQLLQGKSHAAFDRAGGPPGARAALPIVAPAVERELDNLSLLDRQARHRVTDRVPLHGGGDLSPRVGPGSRGVNRLGAFEVHLASLMGAPAPKLVDGAVADRRQDPGAKRAFASVECGGTVPELEKGLLDDVLREPGVAQDADRHRVREGAVTVVDQREGVNVCRRQRAADLGVACSGSPAWQHPISIWKTPPAREGSRTEGCAAGANASR